jgi:hypothetical protein
MKSYWITGAAIVFALAALTVAAQDRGAEKHTLDGGNRGSVPFPHRLHQDTLNDCQACHGLFPMEAGGIKQAQKQGAVKVKQVMNEGCIACHKKAGAAGGKSGPVKCADCHVKS